MHLPLTYLGQSFLLEHVVIAHPGNVSGNPPVVELASCFIKGVVLWHWADGELFEPCRQWLHWLTSSSGLGVDVEDVGSASQAVVLGKGRDCAVVQELDPLDGSMDAIALGNHE